MPFVIFIYKRNIACLVRVVCLFLDEIHIYQRRAVQARTSYVMKRINNPLYMERENMNTAVKTAGVLWCTLAWLHHHCNHCYHLQSFQLPDIRIFFNPNPVREWFLHIWSLYFTCNACVEQGCLICCNWLVHHKGSVGRLYAIPLPLFFFRY